MKKQFLRFRQITDQAFLRPEKSNALTEDLHNAEKRVDLIKQSCEGTGKKINACMQRLSPDFSTGERRQKNTPEKLLAMCMQENGTKLGEDSIFGITLTECANLQEILAGELLAFKSQVEETVLEPINTVVKDDYPSISKLRKQLTKLTQDMDNAKTKYNTASKHCQQMTGSNVVAATAKAEGLKEEAEDASMKVEQCRDALATEMLTLISHEPKLSWLLVEWYRLQADYHQKVLSSLQSTIPVLESRINKFPQQPVFGVPLEEHLHTCEKSIASVIEFCACWLLDTAINEEGLFRIGGSASKVKKLKSAFEAGVMHMTEDLRDPHTVAGVLKLYLRELPEPLMTATLYDQWLDAARIPDHDARLQALWTVVNNLPETNFKNLRYLIKFLAELTKNSEINKMSSQNLAIVMAPNLIWSPMEDMQLLGVNMTVANYHSVIVDNLITYCDWFFPEEVPFVLSPPTSPFCISSDKDYQNATPTFGQGATNGEIFGDLHPSSPSNMNNSPKSGRFKLLYPVKKKPASSPYSAQNKEELIKTPITRSASCSLEFSQWTSRIGPLQTSLQSSPMGTALCSLKDDDLEQSFQHRKSIIHSRSHEDLLHVNNSATENGNKNSPEHQKNKIAETTWYDSILHLTSDKQANLQQKSPQYIEKSTKLPSYTSYVEKTMPASRPQVERPTVPPPKIPESDKLDSEPNETANKKELQYLSEILGVDDITLSFIPYSHTNRYDKDDSISFMDDSDQDEKVLSKTPSGSSLNSVQATQVVNNGKEILSDTFQHAGSSGGNEVKQNGYRHAYRQESVEQSSDNVLPCNIKSFSALDADNVTVFSSTDPENRSTDSQSVSDKQYCTVIQVGGNADSISNTNVFISSGSIKPKVTRPLSPPPPKPLKPVFNTETQDTRL